jgi:hypothetical protein
MCRCIWWPLWYPWWWRWWLDRLPLVAFGEPLLALRFKSQTRTWLSSPAIKESIRTWIQADWYTRLIPLPPVQIWPDSLGAQLMQLTLAWWLLTSSVTGALGNRISRICTDIESMWNVANRWCSIRLNSSRRRGAGPPPAGPPTTLLVGWGVSYKMVECSNDLLYPL